MKFTLLSVLALSALLTTSGSGQNPSTNNEQRLLALVKEVETQQAQITSNQEKIDSKLAEITEAIRVARIFAGRGGH